MVRRGFLGGLSLDTVSEGMCEFDFLSSVQPAERIHQNRPGDLRRLLNHSALAVPICRVRLTIIILLRINFLSTFLRTNNKIN